MKKDRPPNSGYPDFENLQYSQKGSHFERSRFWNLVRSGDIDPEGLVLNDMARRNMNRSPNDGKRNRSNR